MVDVRSYIKRDGTQVREHTRSAPTVAVAGGGTGPIVFGLIMYGFASHNIHVTVPPMPSQTTRPAAVTHQLASHGKLG